MSPAGQHKILTLVELWSYCKMLIKINEKSPLVKVSEFAMMLEAPPSELHGILLPLRRQPYH
jgi:hypothetical protein